MRPALLLDQLRHLLEPRLVLRRVHLRLLRRGAPVLTLQAERTPGGEDVHGTGCALSTAISCFIAQGYSLESAVREAVAKVREWLRIGFFLTR